jgi:hypothetical protein
LAPVIELGKTLLRGSTYDPRQQRPLDILMLKITNNSKSKAVPVTIYLEKPAGEGVSISPDYDQWPIELESWVDAPVEHKAKKLIPMQSALICIFEARRAIPDCTYLIPGAGNSIRIQFTGTCLVTLSAWSDGYRTVSEHYVLEQDPSSPSGVLVTEMSTKPLQ